MGNTIFDLINEHKPRHSDFQMDHFVTMKAGGTLWGMRQQAKAEVFGRYEAFRIEFFAAVELSHRIEFYRRAVNPGMEGMLDDVDLDGASAFIDGERICKATVFKLEAELSSTVRGLKMKLEEIIRFFAQYKALKEAVGDLSELDENEEEERKWAWAFKKQAAKDIMATGKISGETYDCLIALGAERMSGIMADIESVMEEDATTLVSLLASEDALPCLVQFLPQAEKEIFDLLDDEYGVDDIGLLQDPNPKHPTLRLSGR